MSQYGDFPELRTDWYHTVNSVKPIPAEQITDRLIILRKNIVETKDEGGNTVYSYDERVVGVEQWETYQDIWGNTGDIQTTDHGLMETYELVDTHTTEIEDINNALIELYESMLPAEEA